MTNTDSHQWVGIDSHIPIPETRKTGPRSDMARTARSMAIGDSVIVNGRDIARLYSAMRAIGFKSTRRAQVDGSMRIWRVE